VNHICFLFIVAVLIATIGDRPLPAQEKPKPASVLRKPTIADTVKVNVYADNWFALYINGELVAVDPIKFVPHNVVSIEILPSYPMTIAVLAKDNADPKTGMEYANTNIGDGGFILKIGDGTVTNTDWKARRFSWGPVDGDVKSPRVVDEPLPKDWFAADFDDSQWSRAKSYTAEQVGPKQPFYDYDFAGAEFVWTGDLALDNVVIFRHRVEAAPDGKDRPDFSDLNNVVPVGPRGPGRGRNRPAEQPQNR
jgi:hypothetical protein